MSGPRHLVMVEAYEGLIEFLSDDPAEQRASCGLGLPLRELAETLDARLTVLGWDDWRRDEARFGSPFTWEWPAATRPAYPPPFEDRAPDFGPRVRRAAVPAREPERGLPIYEIAQSPMALGLISHNDLLFLLSWCLNAELARLFREDPFQAVIVPVWGGLGYVPMMARATGVAGFAAPFAAVATGLSVQRQRANQEGLWTRPALVRRQAEDLSLALADLVLTFGPLGDRAARAGRPPEAPPPVRAPRRVDKMVLEQLAAEAGRPAPRAVPLQLFLREPQDGTSGALSALDAVRRLAERGVRLDRPVVSSGPSMIFAPMKPRLFAEYWSSRGWVRELVEEGQWRWEGSLEGSLPLRLYPSWFEHLPDVWTELARGSALLLSPAAAEGLAPGEELPPEVLIGGDPDPERLAGRLAEIAEMGVERIDRARRELCRKVVAAQQGEARRLLAGTAEALAELVDRPQGQDLGRVAVSLLDRRPGGVNPGGAISPGRGASPFPDLASSGAKQSSLGFQPQARARLSVIVTCYEMGSMIREAVESVWASERIPDEVLVVDDGSKGEETLAALAELERVAAGRGLPLRVLRQRNQGLAGARNAGLAAASGEFISFLDGDDWIEPPFYRLAVDLLERSPRLGGVAAWSVCLGPAAPVGFWNPPQPELPFLFVENCVFVPCMTRTALLRELGGYDVRQRFNYEDWELSVRLLAAGWPIVTIPAYLARYRVRPDSLLRTMTPIQNQVMRERLLETHRETASRFALEIAMQIEHRLKTVPPSGESARKPLWKTTARRFLSLARTPLRRRGRP